MCAVVEIVLCIKFKWCHPIFNNIPNNLHNTFRSWFSDAQSIYSLSHTTCFCHFHICGKCVTFHFKWCAQNKSHVIWVMHRSNKTHLCNLQCLMCNRSQHVWCICIITCSHTNAHTRVFIFCYDWHRFPWHSLLPCSIECVETLVFVGQRRTWRLYSNELVK